MGPPISSCAVRNHPGGRPQRRVNRQVITFTEYKGIPANPASTWAVMINYSPILSIVVIARFAPDGNLVLSGVVPPGLSGYTITFRGYAIGQSGPP